MSKFRKVSELEWYLHMEAFHKTFGGNSGILDQENTMNLRQFHEFWLELRAPGYNRSRNEVVLNAPFDIKFYLYPGQAIEIPLGFHLPKEFAIIQGKKDNYIVSVHKMPGLTGGIGYVLRIVNVYDQPCTYQCAAGEPLVSGYLLNLDITVDRERSKRKWLICDSLETYDPEADRQVISRMVYPFPGVFRKNDMDDPDKYYLAAEYNGADPCIHIMKKGKNEPDLLRDISIYCFKPDDFDPHLDPTTAFRERFSLAANGEEIIPKKKYFLPHEKIDVIPV